MKVFLSAENFDTSVFTLFSKPHINIRNNFLVQNTVVCPINPCHLVKQCFICILFMFFWLYLFLLGDCFHDGL